jgi:hypothetical protein
MQQLSGRSVLHWTDEWQRAPQKMLIRCYVCPKFHGASETNPQIVTELRKMSKYGKFDRFLLFFIKFQKFQKYSSLHYGIIRKITAIG